MPNALWRGAISFGLVTIPVSLYPAKNTRGEISFHLLHKSDLSRVHNKHVDEAGHDVSLEEIVKGYEYEKNRYVVIEESDLKAANVEATQTIDIMAFVEGSQIDIAFYDTPYYTAPAKAGRKAYALLRETMRRTGKVGIGKLVIRERQHLCAVVVDGSALLAFTLRWPYQLRDAADLDLPGEDLEAAGVSPQELNMAEQLVGAMVADWNPGAYRDTFHEDLLRLIDQKVKTGQVTAAPEPVAPEEHAQVVDIMTLLKRSMEQVKPGAEAGVGVQRGEEAAAADAR